MSHAENREHTQFWHSAFSDLDMDFALHPLVACLAAVGKSFAADLKGSPTRLKS